MDEDLLELKGILEDALDEEDFKEMLFGIEEALDVVDKLIGDRK